MAPCSNFKSHPGFRGENGGIVTTGVTVILPVSNISKDNPVLPCNCNDYKTFNPFVSQTRPVRKDCSTLAEV
ncbi:hypothetical protein evm_006580 [Chilo suppressalis]|nr:hypothetical protein evm_006580 [Chilo suppressalis]